MKKFIHIVSFVFIAVLFSVVSVKAQSTEKYEADIPFDFSVGGKTYQAGNYTVKIVRSSGLGAFLTLLNSEGKALDSLAVRGSGDVAYDNSTFIFERKGDYRSLTKIVTPEIGYELPQAREKRRSASIAALK